MFLAPALLLGAVELGLRLANVGHSTAFFKQQIIRGESCFVENDQFGLNFFPPELARSPAPVVMRARKAPGVFRIFLMGESAALGDPAPAFGIGRYLEALLRQRFPGSEFEVICVAMTAINSHAILPIAKECAKHEGDLWIVYMGNNEMVGPFGAATAFGVKAPPRWIVRTRLALQKLRTFQALADLGSRWTGKRSSRTWEGMRLFLEHQLPPDDSRRGTVYRNFEANLADILEAGARARVPILLSTVAVNLSDCPPFASMPSRASGTNPPPQFEQGLSVGTKAEAAGNWLEAVQQYESASALVPHYAEAEFRLGRCQLALSNYTAARASFERACDDDALPFRTDSRLNTIIEDAAQNRGASGVRLFDAATKLAAYSPFGAPGNESFYEHVHLHFDGNFRLARALAEAVAEQLPAAVLGAPTPEWASQEQCEGALALTDWNRRDVYENFLLRLNQPPFRGQKENPERIKLWREKLAEVTVRLTTTNAAAARAVYLEAIRDRPGDFRLHANYADFLEARRELPGATAQWAEVQSLIPHHHLPAYQLGRLMAAQGQRKEARKWLDRAVSLRPDLGAGWFELGLLSYAEERYDQALRELARARQLVPQDPRIPFQSAKALSQLKQSDRAVEESREALRLDPNFWQARSFLGEELAFQGKVEEARREFEAVLRVKPDYSWAHLNLGVALFKLGHIADAQREFEEALRLDPQLVLARQYLDQLRSSSQPAR